MVGGGSAILQRESPCVTLSLWGTWRCSRDGRRGAFGLRAEALRYLAGPPISADDLKVLADTTLAPTRLRNDPDLARLVVETVLLGLDRRRFPWVGEERDAEEAERQAATLASAALIAPRRVLTNRANEAKEAQEQAVGDRLLAADFEKLPAPREVPTLAQAPGRGQFCRETTFGTRKADLLIGLWDDRKMPLECKVDGDRRQGGFQQRGAFSGEPMRVSGSSRQTGAAGLEPATPGFGDRLFLASLCGLQRRRHRPRHS